MSDLYAFFRNLDKAIANSQDLEEKVGCREGSPCEHLNENGNIHTGCFHSCRFLQEFLEGDE